MKRRSRLFVWVLSFLFVFLTALPAYSDEFEYPIMQPDKETLLQWISWYESAPIAPFVETDYVEASNSVLSHLDYVASQRNQGSCGNCWAWAGQALMGIDLDIQYSVFDRLSVQYINSCESSVIGKTCCSGGWLQDVADFYTDASVGAAIPWSNTNANWQDGDASCDTPCASISTSPDYPITGMTVQTVPTHDVGQAQAIANIKNQIDQGEAVWFAFFLPTGADWTQFGSFWSNQGESVIHNLDYGCGKTWEPYYGGGHAVTIVGYNDSEPNPYWVVLNSWGTAGGNRPNGLFRLDMDMNYDCTFYDGGQYWSYYWQVLDIDWGAISSYDFCFIHYDTELYFDYVAPWWLIGEAKHPSCGTGDLIGVVSPWVYILNRDWPSGSSCTESVFLMGHLWDLSFNWINLSGGTGSGTLVPCPTVGEAPDAQDAGMDAADVEYTYCFQSDSGIKYEFNCDGYYLLGQADHPICGVCPLLGAVEYPVFSWYVDIPSGTSSCTEGYIYAGLLDSLSGIWHNNGASGEGNFVLTPCSTGSPLFGAGKPDASLDSSLKGVFHIDGAEASALPGVMK
jgi:hypothetical protein